MIKVFIIGSNHFVENESSKLIEKIGQSDIETYFGDELNRNDFFSFVNSVSLFGDPKIAFVRNAHNIKNLDDFLKNLESCIETHLIFTADINSIKKPQELVKGLSFSLIEEKIKKPTAAQVIEVFKSKNIDISSFNASIVLDMCQNDMNIVAQEAEKFFLYKQSNPDITSAQLIEFVSGEKQEPIYKIVEAFSARRTSESFRIYSTIQKNDANLRSLFFAINKRIINLYFSYISDILVNEYQDFVKRNIADHRRFWSKEELSDLISLTSNFDTEIKTGKKQVENAVNELLAISNIRKR